MKKTPTYKLNFIILLLILGLLLPLMPIHAQQDEIKIPKISVEEYKDKPVFNYEPQKAQQNIFVLAYDWLKRKLIYILSKLLEWIFGQEKAGHALVYILKSLPYIAVLLFVYLIFRFLLGVDLIRYKSQSQSLGNKVYLTDEERIIHEEDLLQLIQQAIAHKDFRLAVRYYYLFTLKQLKDAGLIQWHADKTNRDYVRELSKTELKPLFKNLTFIYDYVWYGNYRPKAEDFEHIEADFKRFNV